MDKLTIPLTINGVIGPLCLIFYIYSIVKKSK